MEPEEQSTIIINDDLLLRLPFLADALLPLIDAATLSCVCRGWRRGVQASLVSLRPKSELALPFIAGCSLLKDLDLSHTFPAPGHTALFAHISAATGLTRLAVDLSATAAWRGQALEVAASDTGYLAPLKCLQVLQLSHQPCLVADPSALRPLQLLTSLTHLGLSLGGTGWRPSLSNWEVLGTLTGLFSLDVAGWGCCCVTQDTPGSSGSSKAGPSQAPAASIPAPRTVLAPLQLLSRMSRLQHLVMADWDVAPSCAGLAALQQLPRLLTLDLSRCLQGQPSGATDAGAAGQQPDSLLDLLQGTAPCQQQQQQQQDAATDQGGSDGRPAGPAVAPAAALAAFSGLQRLSCAGVQLAIPAECWAALPALTHLDVSCCRKLRGEGLCQLQQLQELVASDCSQLDYDALRTLLATVSSLQRLDLQHSTIILHGHGATAAQMLHGRYRRPVLTSPAWPQPSGQPQGRPGRGGSSSSSRRDVADVTGAESAPGPGAGNTAAAAAAAGRAGGSSSLHMQQHSPGSGGLQEVLMSGSILALEEFLWVAPVQDGHGPHHPSLLLFDLVAAAVPRQRLQSLRVLHWRRANAHLTAEVLQSLLPVCAASLQQLQLSGCTLPDDPACCWRGLGAATGLQRLDLNDAGFRREGYQTPCGTNPTVALLAAVARMRLHSLGLSGWRFFFATLKPLAGLAGCLESVDLSRARDVTDSQVWSLTHLTGLTWLSLAAARVSNDQIFSLVLSHMPRLRHLDLSGISNFTARSISSLLHLPNLTSLDIRNTQAYASEAAAKVLVQLPRCRRLAVSLDDGPQHQHQHQHQHQQQELQQREQQRQHMQGSHEGADAEAWHQQLQQAVSATEIYGRGHHASVEHGLQVYAHVGLLGRCQGLRQLLLGGSTPEVSAYCRSLLPPWVDVR